MKIRGYYAIDAHRCPRHDRRRAIAVGNDKHRRLDDFDCHFKAISSVPLRRAPYARSFFAWRPPPLDPDKGRILISSIYQKS